MELAGLILFVGGAFGILVLFTLKHFEQKGRKLVPLRAHHFLDFHAEKLKSRIANSHTSVLKSGPVALIVFKYLIHLSALKFAQFARWLETKSHAVADRVSHKHSFQRRDSRSEFLRQVSEVRNGDFENK